MKDKIIIASAGFIGAAAPSLAELVSMCKTGAFPGLPFYVGAFIMGCMGAVVVSLAKETVAWKAFTQGMSAPALFSSAATVATTVALLNVLPVAYAQQDTAVVDKLATVIVCYENTGRVYFTPQVRQEPVGSAMIIMKDSLYISFVVPDKDTVKLMVKTYDPVIRRAFVQGILPMQRNLTEKFDKKLLVEELK